MDKSIEVKFQHYYVVYGNHLTDYSNFSLIMTVRLVYGILKLYNRLKKYSDINIGQMKNKYINYKYKTNFYF